MLEFTLINNKTLRKPTVGINMVTAELPEKLNQIWNEKIIPKPEDFNENIKMSGLISADNTINLNEVTVVEERMKTTVESRNRTNVHKNNEILVFEGKQEFTCIFLEKLFSKMSNPKRPFRVSNSTVLY